MTAINIFHNRHRAAILTDTAVYDSDGIVHGFGQKAAAIPQLNAAVATRGAAALPSLLAMSLGIRFQSFDALIADGGAAIEAIYEEFLPLLLGSGETEFELFIAGWSEAENRPAVYELQSQDSPCLDGREPWTFYQLDDDAYLASPDPGDKEQARHGFPMDKDVDRLDPIADGLKLMQAQRYHTGRATTHSTQEGLHLVGGAALLTEVRADGITQRIIHRWNDAVGELIRPEPFVVRPSMGMSRQQRRAMERQQRKSHA